MGREACLLLLFEGACYLYEAANYIALFKTILDSNVYRFFRWPLREGHTRSHPELGS